MKNAEDIEIASTKHIKLYKQNIGKKVFNTIAESMDMEYPAIVLDVQERVSREDLILIDRIIGVDDNNKYRLYFNMKNFNYVGNIELIPKNLHLLLTTFKESKLYLIEEEGDERELSLDDVLSLIKIS